MKIFWLFIKNTFAWLTLQLSLSYLFMKIPAHFFDKLSCCFRTFSWEQGGDVWQRWFKVKQWKTVLPDSSSIYSKSFNHRNLEATDDETLNTFRIEANRAEMTHGFSLLLFPLFYLWNPKWAARLNLGFAIMSNLPFIIIQRYNRPKIEQLLKKKGRKYDTTRTKKR
ncbi:glycosyl-4,4'-diaponeurosporenoate acyltransferase [Macrococcus hajekii]|uniref:Glycosyl-4,4'-diaponeurosporenoate acyltransferase n=1 Tax=Macrococcus hajekii TaxID=198482 RepID=A0A4R6BJP7_9STAP|nr:glycosyl-4,4'-diaponeurosporenoate acyltransferase [Macrococcus hajekii]TDM01932.1 glycosyl-4,4'-diaponeurosporenoate acyltransferase [Macrococcus hajekii]